METIFRAPKTSPDLSPPTRQKTIRLSAARRYTRRAMILAAAALYVAVMISRDGHNAPVIASISMAAFLGSIAGFAFSAICGAVLFHLSDDPVRVVEIMIVCSIANQASMTWSLRHHIDWRILSIYLAGGAIGVAGGVWVLLHADRWTYTHGIGAFLLAYGVFMLFRKPMVLNFHHPALDVVIGMLGGVTGGAAGFPSAALSIWIGTKGWDRLRQRAVLQPFILIMQVAALLGISLAQPHAAGLTGLPFSSLTFIPISLLGTSLGMALCSRMSDLQFAKAVNVMLIVSGLGFVL
nr:sulfite exporter TauE/SafE family protein [uncultured Rhodopila sp.]